MVGSKYKYKLLSDSPVKTVAETRNGFVIFDDGSRIEQSRILELFDEVTDNIPGSTFEVVNDKEDINTIIQESSNIQRPSANISLTDVDVVNPDTFFDDSRIVTRIQTEAEKLAESLKNAPSSDIDNVTGARTVETPKELPVDDNPGPVKQVIVGREDYPVEEQKKEGFQPLYTKTGEPINPTAGKIENTGYNEPNVGNMLLKQMKRSKKVKLNIKLDEMIPNPSFIKMMDENFDGGIIDYLVTDIVSKLLNNPSIMEKQIKDSLEEIVYNKKRKPTRKTVKRTKQKTTNVTKKEVKDDDTNSEVVSN